MRCVLHAGASAAEWGGPVEPRQRFHLQRDGAALLLEVRGVVHDQLDDESLQVEDMEPGGHVVPVFVALAEVSGTADARVRHAVIACEELARD